MQASVQNNNQGAQGRLSVAALSRNFDVRAQRINRVVDLENVPPNPPAAESNSHNRENQYSQLDQRSLSNINIGRGTASNNSSNGVRGIRELNARFNRRLNEDNNNDNNQRAQARSTAIRRDELVPKHVAISPQAFLKFFSL